ncbi:MAG TPA: EAL domain-containing protein [Burkholderiales bacterium]|nr:EAL domain-containing protein [Burkholderiales bacterium]
MATTNRILLLEDDPADVELLLRALQSAAFPCTTTVVDSEPDFTFALDQFVPDIILSDFTLPEFDGLSALRIARNKCPDTPFIFVSGATGEQRAIEALTYGACDYVLKNNLMHLGPALRRAIQNKAKQNLAEKKGGASGEQLRLIMESVKDMIALLDTEGKRLYCSHSYEKLFDDVTKLVGTDSFGEIHPEDVERIRALFYDTVLTGGEHRAQFRLLLKDNSVRFIESQGSVIRDFTGKVAEVVVVSRDITEQRKSSEALRLAASALENIAESVIITDTERSIISVNKAFSAITGFAPEEVIGKKPDFLRCATYEENFYATIWGEVRETGRWKGEIRSRRKGGEVYPELVSISAVRDESGIITHYVSVASDITKFKQDEARLDFFAHSDPLTRLPNRTRFQDRCEQMLIRTRPRRGIVGLLFIDLDNFKTVNDSLGHSAGDSLLQAAAERLGECLRDGDVVSRQGGDEFAVLLDELRDPQDAALVAEKLLHVLSKPFLLGGHKIFISASIGISCYPQDGIDVDTLLKNADAAMYRAKEHGRNAYQFFSPEMNGQALETLLMTNCLRSAIERQEFLLYYQPRIELSSGRITAVEALIRWRHPERGLVSPATFIPLAEKTGLIGPIGEWVLRTACIQARVWQNRYSYPIKMAVNLSAYQFRQPNLVEQIASVLKETGLDPNLLELEITEGMVMHEPERVEKVLMELKEMGITISLDDFGTGYSSLSYLKRFSINSLKIDQSFVRDIPGDANDCAITQAIIALAKSLQLNVVAEGIEKEQQLAFLHANGCEEGQGYLFSRPQPAPDLEELLSKNDRH